MKKAHFTSLIITLISSSAIACSFIPDSFCETNNSRPNDIVICGKIFQIDSDGIDIEVFDVLKGIEVRDTIRVWDGTDFECNGLHSMAATNIGSLNDTVIVILPLIDSIENTWDVIGDYRCPNFWAYIIALRVINNTVTGYVDDIWNTSHIPYDDFKNNWLNSTNECSNWLGINKQVEDIQLAVYPNPTSSMVHIDLSQLAQNVSISVFNSHGTLVHVDEVHRLSSFDYQLPQTKGIYFIRLTVDGDSVKTAKIVKE